MMKLPFRRGKAKHSPRTRRLYVEPLEDRVLLATFTVNSTADALNPTPGFTTLRSAVVEANALFGDDTINLPAGNYRFSIAGRGENAAAAGDLDIKGNLRIVGAGAGSTTIDASGVDRVFQVFAGVTLDLTGVTITGGETSGDLSISSSETVGGGIFNEGLLTLTNSIVANNNVRASDFNVNTDGGGIWSHDGTLTITNSTFSGNSSAGGTAGIAVLGGTATITNSTFSGNSAVRGGGIANGGTLTITDSTFSDNSANLVGGGIANDGTLTITNNTFSGNSANGGGGIGI